jgi:Flp pilus assembly protein TadG
MTPERNGAERACAHEVCRVMLARLAVRLGLFRRDARGIAAVEFALVAPVLVTMLVGAVDISRAVALNQRVGLVTQMVADLAARETQLTAADVEAIYDIAQLAMAPYPTDTLKISIIPVMSAVDDAENTVVYPSTTNRPTYPAGSELPKCQAYPLAKDFLMANESVIVVETSYDYEPLWAKQVVAPITWQKKAYAKPRKALCVGFDGANCTSSCFSS